MKYEINYYCISHIGKCRKVNQDNFLCERKYLDYDNHGTQNILTGRVLSSKAEVFSVFDGMGGEEKGEMAAYIAAKSLAECSFRWKTEKELLHYCKKANMQICGYADKYKINSMGTTMATLLFSKNKIGICNIGDSKIFCLSRNELCQISQDHIFASAIGVKPPLTQNLGIPEDEFIISPYISTCAYKDGDVYLICSDGLTDMLSLEQLKMIMEQYDGRKASEQLLEQALEKGGKDNITFILLYVNKRKSVAHKLKWFVIDRTKN